MTLKSDSDPADFMQRLATIGSVGTEMVAPIGVGLLLDYWLTTMPWFTVALAILGFVGGILHLIHLNKPHSQQ